MNRAKSPLLSLSLVVLSLLLLSLLPASVPTRPLIAQEEDGPDPSTEGIFFESVDVNVVNIDVYVTDRDGQRVTGLTRDDFLLELDRQPVAITNFYAVEGGVAHTESGEVVAPAEPVDPRLKSENRRQVPEDQKLHLVVYVDNLNLRPFSRNRALRYVRNFLRTRLRRGDEVMLLTFERSLHVRHRFTSDPDLIASALFEVEEMSGLGVHSDSDRRDILRDIIDSANLYEVRGRAHQYAESLFSDMRFTIDALQGVVEELAGLPGRKAILYVSDGLPMRAGEDIYHAMNEEFREDAGSILMETHNYDLTRRFQQLTSKANTNGVTFYTIEAAGLRTYTFMDASNSTVSNSSSRVDQIHFSNIQSTLRYMADETGGFAMVNTNNFEPLLSRMAEDFDTYYALGFTPSASEAGRYRSVKVKLKERRKGWKLRYRDGYRDKTVSTRMADTTLAALHYGYQRNPLGIEIQVGEERNHSSGRFLVPVKVLIPIRKLSFLPQEEMQRGRVRLFVGAKDSEGGLAPIQDLPVPIDIPIAEFERAKEQFYEYEITLMMRRGPQVVAVGVRDEIGAVTGFITRGVRIGA